MKCLRLIPSSIAEHLRPFPFLSDPIPSGSQRPSPLTSSKSSLCPGLQHYQAFPVHTPAEQAMITGKLTLHQSLFCSQSSSAISFFTLQQTLVSTLTKSTEIFLPGNTQPSQSPKRKQKLRKKIPNQQRPSQNSAPRPIIISTPNA